MNLEPDCSGESFRREVREYLSATLRALVPPGLRGRDSRLYDRELLTRWADALNARGWMVPDWPVELGGMQWTPAQRRIFGEELIIGGCPPTDNIGIGFVGPVIYTFGNAEQKKRYLPRIRSGADLWCQGFSEPQSGSDVTSLRTSAVRHGDQLLINGQKIWTTNAHNADKMFALIRIMSPRTNQPGLSFVLIDMRAPGITVRPIISIDGCHRLNEVFLKDVRVPAENLVGEEGKGWFYARFLLSNERTIVAGLPISKLYIASIRQALREHLTCDRAYPHAAQLQLRLARLEIELESLEFLELRLLHARKDEAAVQMLAPMLKVRGTELRQKATELMFDVLGDSILRSPVREADIDDDHHDETESFVQAMTVQYLIERSATIAGGTSEIQRNLIAGVSLGM